MMEPTDYAGAPNPSQGFVQSTQGFAPQNVNQGFVPHQQLQTQGFPPQSYNQGFAPQNVNQGFVPQQQTQTQGFPPQSYNQGTAPQIYNQGAIPQSVNQGFVPPPQNQNQGFVPQSINQGFAPQAQQTRAQPSRLDTSAMPSPISVDASVPASFDTSLAPRLAPITSLVPTRYVDQGNAALSFLRVSSNIPVSSSLSSSTNLPFSVLSTPLADTAFDEVIPVVTHGERGPVRCQRCRAYVNSQTQFVSGGREYVCKLCDSVNTVPEVYFSPLDAQGRRIDLADRPELTHGTVEYIATNPLYLPPAKPLCPPSLFFLIDCSASAQSTGITKSVCVTIKNILKSLIATEEETESKKVFPNRIGIISYAAHVHYWDLHGKKPVMHVLPNVYEKPFVPLFNHAHLFAAYDSNQEIIDDVLDGLWGKYATLHSNIGEKVALISAMHCASMALRTLGGRIIVFTKNIALVGEGERNENKVASSENEAIKPRNPEIMKTIVPEFVKNGTSVEMFVLSLSASDLLSDIGPIVQNTGGKLHFLSKFSPERSTVELESLVRRSLTKQFGIDALFRIRTSNGISVSRYDGNLSENADGTDIDLCCVDPSTTVLAFLTHDERLEPNTFAYIQSALVYTDQNGVRKIRVSTREVKVDAVEQNLFKSVDIDVVLTALTRQAVTQSFSSGYTSASKTLRDSSVAMLASYRKHCFNNSPRSQLILPDALKLLPIFVHSLMKDDGLVKGFATVDERIAKFVFYKGCTPLELQLSLYPRAFPLHEILQLNTPLTPNGLPKSIRLSTEYIAPDGVYLVDFGSGALKLFFGSQNGPSQEIAIQLFGTADITSDDLVSNFYAHSVCVEGIVQSLISSIATLRRNNSFCILIGRPDELSKVLREDTISGTETYSDFLCAIHKEIQTKVN